MKILMIFTSRFQYTGITRSVLNYYHELIKRDDVFIDFLIPNEIDDSLEKEINYDKSNVHIIKMKIRRFLPIVYFYKFSKILKKNKYDIVHVHGSSSILCYELLTAKLCGVKTRIAHCHSTSSEHKFLHKVLYPLFRKSYTDAFACGEAAGEWLFKGKQFTIINNAQDVSLFSFNNSIRNKLRKQYNIDNKIVLGHVGNFAYVKNHEFLIDLYEKLLSINNNYYLVIIGNGPLFQQIKDKIKIKNLKDRILLLGTISNVNEWLSALDIMLLPSKYEGFPNVVVEWQINGIPCILSDRVTKMVAMTDLVNFCKLNICDWVEQIQNIKLNTNNRSNHKYIENIIDNGFEIKSASDNLYNIYKSLLNNNER